MPLTAGKPAAPCRQEEQRCGPNPIRHRVDTDVCERVNRVVIEIEIKAKHGAGLCRRRYKIVTLKKNIIRCRRIVGCHGIPRQDPRRICKTETWSRGGKPGKGRAFLKRERNFILCAGNGGNGLAGRFGEPNSSLP